MSQARLTDYFAQRKSGSSEASTRRKGNKQTQQNGVENVFLAPPIRSKARSKSTATTRSTRSANSVHEEFLRVIEEATASDPADTERSKGFPPSPLTPKRTAAEAEFDLGAAVFSATADHSTAKKKQRLDAKKGADDATKESGATVVRRTAKKRLILPQEDEPSTAQSLVTGVADSPPLLHPAVAEKQTKNQVNHSSTNSPQAGHTTSKQTRKQDIKALSKDDVAALKSRLQKIKKQAEKLSPAPVPPAPSAVPAAKDATPTTKASTKTPTSPAVDGSALKATVARAKELAARAQRRKEQKKEEENKEAQPETQPQTQPQTQDGDSLPAYQRYHTLAQAVPPGLSLPYQYKLLAEMFRSMDTIVGMLYNRSETVTFGRVKQGVQDMMHKRFEESHVGQIRTVFPAAYTYRQEKNIPSFSSSIKKGSYQLTVEPVIHTDQQEARPLLSASRLLERRQIFHQNLVSIVKQHHKEFLSSLDSPLSVPDDKLTRWHPRFNVDTVPAVQPGPLPQSPHTDKLTTAQEVLDKARSLMTPKMEKALANLALKTAETAAESGAKESAVVSPNPSIAAAAAAATTTTSTPTTTATQTPGALKGVSQSLLERIRAKEAQKLQAAMTRNPVQEERLLMMSRLGELARILRNVFVAEKKPALIMELACNRMVASYRSALSTGDMEKHLRLLAELTPDWLTIHPIRKDFYLKLSKTMELNVVLEKLNIKTKEEERL